MEDQEFLIPEFRKESLEQLKALKPQDVVLFNYEQLPTRYTIVIQPEEPSLSSIRNVQTELQHVDPSQYFYKQEEIHLTLLGDIPTDIKVKSILDALKSALTLEPMAFELYGLASNAFCCSLSAYPLFDLARFREKMRHDLGVPGDNYSLHLATYEKMGWINILRYLQQPVPDFLSTLYAKNASHFGRLEVKKIQLYRNSSKILSKDRRELIFELKL